MIFQDYWFSQLLFIVKPHDILIIAEENFMVNRQNQLIDYPYWPCT